MLSLPQSGQQTGSNTMVLSHSMIVSSIPAKFSIDGNTSRTLPSHNYGNGVRCNSLVKQQAGNLLTLSP
jgi:hypothetical protein